MNEIFVGKTTDGFPLCLKDVQRCEHVQVVGSTGRGKTMSVILPWMVQDFIHGKSVILIDGKGDRSLADQLSRFASDPSDVVVFDISNIERSAVTNPLRHGSPQQIADRIFSTFEFDNSYYEKVSFEALLLVTEILTDVDEEITFQKIYRALTSDAYFMEFVTAHEELKAELKNLALEYMARAFKERQEKLSGFLSQLRPFAIGEISILLNGEVSGKDFFSLSDLVKRNHETKAVVILIPTLLYQKTASRLGQMFLQEIAWALVARENMKFIPVFLDEFSSFVYEGFLQILNKARSSNVGFHLSHQSMGDLEGISPEFAKAVVTNTNIKCVLGVNDPESADFFARLFGTREANKTTERAERKPLGDLEMSGFMSVRAVEEYKIHPNKLKAMSRGQGVLSFLSHGEPITEEVQFEPIPKF